MSLGIPRLDGRPVQHLVSLVSVEDDATGEELEVVWEIEPGTEVIERAELPRISPDELDDPSELDAFLDAVRWGAVTSAAGSVSQRDHDRGLPRRPRTMVMTIRSRRCWSCLILIGSLARSSRVGRRRGR